MSDSISFKGRKKYTHTHHLKDSSWQERIQARQWRNIQVQNVSMSVFRILMLSETGLQADKMDTSNKRTFLLYSPIPQMASVTKQFTKRFQNKNTSCTQNVQPLFETK